MLTSMYGIMYGGFESSPNATAGHDNIYIGVSVARGKAIKLHKSDLWNFGFQTKKKTSTVDMLYSGRLFRNITKI